MKDFYYGYFIVYGLLNVSAIALLVLFIIDLVKIYRKGAGIPKLRQRIIKISVFIFLMLVIPISAVKLINFEPNLDSHQKRIEYHTKFKNYFQLNNEYFELLQKYPLSYPVHFKYVSTIRSFIDNKKERAFNPSEVLGYYESERMVKYYREFIEKNDTVYRDIGYTFLSMHYIDVKSSSDVIIDSVSTSGRENPFFNYVKGRQLSQSRQIENFDNAESFLNKAITDTLAIREAFNELAFLYYYFNAYDKLKELIIECEKTGHVDSYFVRKVHFRNVDFYSYFKLVISEQFKSISIWGLFSALLILLLWIFYLRKVDIYEPEKWSHTIITLLLSMCTIFLVYPMHDFLWTILKYYPSRGGFETFIHNSISIGLVEEFVKIIPVLLILKLTKAINEPYDYIYYCSISALGFAFIENLSYIQDDSLYNINARAMVAAVAHMVFSSTIGYGMVLSKYKQFGGAVFTFVVFLIIAALLHGFYDYWLINEVATKYAWVTTVYFILCVHVWHIFSNNTLNITTFYSKEIVIKNDKLKIYLIISLLSIFIISFVVNSITRGTAFGFSYLIASSLIYGYFILYLTFSLSKFVLVRGFLKPLSVPLLFLIPRVKRVTDYSGLPINIKSSQRYRLVNKHAGLSSQLPLKGVLKMRLVVDNNLESYLAELSDSLEIEACLRDRVIVMPKFRRYTLNDNGNILCYLYLVPDEGILETPLINSNELEFAGWVISQKVIENY